MATPRTNNRRGKRLFVRYSPAEREQIIKRAAHADLSISDFIRHAALGAPIEVIKLERLHPADLGQIKRLGNLMNQIARAIHRGRMVRGTLTHLEEVLGETRSLIRHQLGKWGAA